MNLTDLSKTAFINPSGSNSSEISALLKRVLEEVLDFSTNAERYPCIPDEPDELESFEFPDFPVGQEAFIKLIQTTLKNSMNPLNPAYIGHMDTMSSTASLAGDLTAAAINNNMLSREMSPFFAELEENITTYMAQKFGLGKKSGGVMLSGGSLANLQALTVARNHMLDTASQALHELPGQPVILASEAAHTSLQKAAMVLGLGNQGVQWVPTDSDSKMGTVALRKILVELKQNRQLPFCLVGTAGTTTTGNIDPLSELSAIAKEHNIWFHVDAAYGGALMFSHKHKHLLAGIEHADSITFNPQKWMYVAKTNAIVLFRNKQLLQREFRISAPYMKEDSETVNIGEISLQGTRHADILKLWLTLQHIGLNGYRQLIYESFELTEYMKREIEKRPFLKLSGKPEMNILCFRATPASLPQEKWDAYNVQLNSYLLEEANYFLSLPNYRSQKWQRAVLLNPYLNKKDIKLLFRYIDHFSV